MNLADTCLYSAYAISLASAISTNIVLGYAMIKYNIICQMENEGKFDMSWRNRDRSEENFVQNIVRDLDSVVELNLEDKRYRK